MMTQRPLLFHMLLMLAYSVLFILAYPIAGDSMIGLNWAALLMHIGLLFILGIVRVAKAETRIQGGQLLLASLAVAIIGHGLCFFNGLLHMGTIH